MSLAIELDHAQASWSISSCRNPRADIGYLIPCVLRVKSQALTHDPRKYPKLSWYIANRIFTIGKLKADLPGHPDAPHPFATCISFGIGLCPYSRIPYMKPPEGSCSDHPANTRFVCHRGLYNLAQMFRCTIADAQQILAWSMDGSSRNADRTSATFLHASTPADILRSVC